jgi:ribosomal protein L24E
LNCDTCGQTCEGDAITVSKKGRMLHFCSGDCEVMFDQDRNGRR